MSDLGSDAGSTSLDLTAKTLEALLRLFEKIFEAWQRAPERAEHKLKLKQAKTEEEKVKAIKRLDGKTGFIKHKMLSNTGQPLTVCGIHLTKEEIKQFNSICSREGILFSTISNLQLKKEGEKAFVGIECRTSDLEKLRAAVDRFNDEKRQEFIDNKIKSIMGKGELSEQDYADLRLLTGQKESMHKDYCNRLNAEIQDNVIQNAYDESKLKPMDISEALNRHTGRYIDKDQHSIIADAINPNKIIKCHGYDDKDPQTGENYIKTDYEVYNGNKCLLRTTDGRFAGKPINYWGNQKKEIEEAADFSGTYYKFYSENEYKLWYEYVNKQNIEELSEMDKPAENKDFSRCIDIGMEKLKENGVELKENILYDKESNQPLQVIISDKSLDRNKRSIVAESIIVGKQIENYKEIQELRNRLDLSKAEMIIAKPESKEYAEAKVKTENLENRLLKAYELDNNLVNERKDINAVQSMQQVEQELGRENGDGRDDIEEDSKHTSLEKVKEEINKEKISSMTKENGNLQMGSQEKIADLKTERMLSSR